jgi:Transcriptional Coactivator p15 (PC4)
MTRLNWKANNARQRIRAKGAESIAGATLGRPAPSTPTVRPPARRAPIPSLSEPVPIAKFWKSARDRSKHVRVELSQYEGHALVNVRVWLTGADGVDRPTMKGVALGIRKLPELAKALALAETKARELGLIQDEAAE